MDRQIVAMLWAFGLAVSSQQQAAGDHVREPQQQEHLQQQKHLQHLQQRQQAGQELVLWISTNPFGVMHRLVDNHYAMDPMRRSFDRYDGALKSTTGSSDREKTYEMPNGNVFNIDNERFRCAEVLFQPSCIGKEASGIHDKSLQSIMTFDEAPNKTGWESSGSDGVKVAELFGLQGVLASYGEYIVFV